MESNISRLRRLVRESRYAVSERAIAQAILRQARMRLAADRAGLRKTLR
jgi:hypothetical protein